jgi:hypothetical protein
MDIDIVQAQWVLELFPAVQIPEFAAQAMMQGFDGPNILELASFHRPTRWDIKPQVFDAALREMGREPLNAAQAALRLARRVALKILRDQINPGNGAAEVYELVVKCGYEEAPAELMDLERRLVDFEDDDSPRRERDQAILEWAWETIGREASP